MSVVGVLQLMTRSPRSKAATALMMLVAPASQVRPEDHLVLRRLLSTHPPLHLILVSFGSRLTG